MARSGPALPLTMAMARDRIRERCFRPGTAGLVGLELEWHVFDRTDPQRIVPLDLLVEVTSGMGTLPGGSSITFEPGGQLELSSPPCDGVDAACAALAVDHDAVAAALAPLDVCLVATGVDPVRPPHRQLRHPRYDAMEAFFDVDGSAGRRMMSRTAALQVNIDHGAAAECEGRWRVAHCIGPALAAAFASSPVAEGHPTGWASTRLATWLDIDPTRTAAVAGGPEEWVSYALAANVLLVRRGAEMVPLRERLPFSAWIRDGHALGPPTLDDLDYHLTTLFPPVRPRGFLELRYLDALPDPWWRVAVAIVAALVQDRAAGEQAVAACAPVANRWYDAARCGLADPAIHAAAAATVAAGLDAFARLPVPVSAATTELCGRYVDRFLSRRRTPGDDLLDAWRQGRPLVPLPPEDDRWT
jgi:ergothioneine biosynthesis glutamate--cysteine ligase EgtA